MFTVTTDTGGSPLFKYQINFTRYASMVLERYDFFDIYVHEANKDLY